MSTRFHQIRILDKQKIEKINSISFDKPKLCELFSDRKKKLLKRNQRDDLLILFSDDTEKPTIRANLASTRKKFNSNELSWIFARSPCIDFWGWRGRNEARESAILWVHLRKCFLSTKWVASSPPPRYLISRTILIKLFISQFTNNFTQFFPPITLSYLTKLSRTVSES